MNPLMQNNFFLGDPLDERPIRDREVASSNLVAPI